MKRLRVGVVGAGMVGQFAHIANLHAYQRCELVALAELRPELRREVAARYAIPRVYETHRELLADDSVEAVVVITRREATGPVVLDALDDGRHVLSEKPMAHSVEQARRLVAAADKAQRNYAIGFMKRFDPGVRVARDLVKTMGDLLRVRACSLHGQVGTLAFATTMTSELRPIGLSTWPLAPEWMPERAHANFAAFLNVHVHLLNLLRYLVPGEVTVESANMKSEDRRSALLKLGSVPCHVEMRDRSEEAWTEGIELHFSNGLVELDLPAPFDRSGVARVRVVQDGEMRDLTPAPQWAFELQSRAFVDDALDARTPVASGKDGIEDLILAEEIARVALRDNLM